jgi:hypothetical protein
MPMTGDLRQVSAIDAEFDAQAPDARASVTDGSAWHGELVVAVVFAAETAVALMCLGGHVSVPMALVLHAVVTVALATWIWSRSRNGHDVVLPLLCLIVTLFLGPLGALGTHGLQWISGRSRDRQELLDAWYARIASSRSTDEVTRLSDAIVVGRSLEFPDGPPPSFLKVMQSGTTAEQQTVLGIIARRFHVDYLPVLDLALQSPVPVVRVQAAAVAARVRDPLQREVEAAADKASAGGLTVEERLECAAYLRKAMVGGLIDESVRERANDTKARLIGTVVQSIEAGTIGRQTLQPEAVDVVERDLIAAGDFAMLRAVRRQRMYSTLGRRRTRVARWARAPRAASEAP